MAKAVDVAAGVLEQLGEPTTAMKLQKLTYYVQALSLGRYGEPAFDSRIEAWRDGPVVKDLWSAIRKMFTVAEVRGGDTSRLTDQDWKVIGETVALYGHYDVNWLINQTHQDAPWVIARNGIAPEAASSTEIGHEAMRTFYSQVLADDEPDTPRDPSSFLTPNEVKRRYALI